MPTSLPAEWSFLSKERSPRMLICALRHFGEREIKGDANNPEIMRWYSALREAGYAGVYGGWYDNDDKPWCGLAHAYFAMEADKPVPAKFLSALAWADWGSSVETPKLGDTLVFKRSGGGHVGQYVGESRDGLTFAVLGGNQSDSMSVAYVERKRLVAARNFYAIGQPSNCRRIFYERPHGPVSQNEA